MSTHVEGIVLADEKYEKMKELWESCEQLGVDIPKDVLEFFNHEAPDPMGTVVEIPHDNYNNGINASGFEVDIRDLPEDVKIIRFYKRGNMISFVIVFMFVFCLIVQHYHTQSISKIDCELNSLDYLQIIINKAKTDERYWEVYECVAELHNDKFGTNFGRKYVKPTTNTNRKENTKENTNQ